MSRSSRVAEFEQEVAARVGHVIKRAEQALIGEKSRVLRDLGLTVPQYAALMALSYSPGMSGAQLARVCLVTPQSMATVLANLESKRLIERQTSDLHQKVLVTKLTPAGRALVKKADTVARKVEAKLSNALSADEQKQLRDLLERCITALTEEETS
ncbi:MarR family transcriptional regulator [Streptomyces sp. NPDC001584]|uniref:MarR family winged helix-turn-helix transcriptional regulator n=1 Tax=Streptomyces sp. NPDC001584 TaxID=3154521 RepID=UPI0033300274